MTTENPGNYSIHYGQPIMSQSLQPRQFAPTDVINMYKQYALNAYPKGRVNNPSTKSHRVYSLTQEHMAQNSRLPHLPVLPGFSQLLYTYWESRPNLALQPFPSIIYPRICWWLYGHEDSLPYFPSTFDTEEVFLEHMTDFRQSVVAFRIQEFNPDVSLSYVWGNDEYTTNRYGNSMGGIQIPDTQAYNLGYADAMGIREEEQVDRLMDTLPTLPSTQYQP